jgi:hypothetical protein
MFHSNKLKAWYGMRCSLMRIERRTMSHHYAVSYANKLYVYISISRNVHDKGPMRLLLFSSRVLRVPILPYPRPPKIEDNVKSMRPEIVLSS